MAPRFVQKRRIKSSRSQRKNAAGQEGGEGAQDLYTKQKKKKKAAAKAPVQQVDHDLGLLKGNLTGLGPNVVALLLGEKKSSKETDREGAYSKGGGGEGGEIPEQAKRVV